MRNYSVALPSINDNGVVESASFMDALPNFSVSFWIKDTGVDDFRQVIGKNDVTTDQSGWKVFLVAPSIALQVNDPSTSYRADDDQVINDGEWHYVVITYDDAVGAVIYVDGIAGSLTEYNTPITPITTTSPFQIGLDSESNPNSSTCKIAALKTWNVTLTAGDAVTLAAGGDVSTGKISDWEFTEGGGVLAADSVTYRIITFTNMTWSTDVPTILQPSSASFSTISLNGLPTWSVVPTIAGNFVPMTATGENIDEVGYNEGGYGEGGYNAPGVIFPQSSAPNWQVYVTK